MFWTDELAEKITRLWQTKTASEIALILCIEDRLALSRNAIVGKLHRMKLTVLDKQIVHVNGSRVGQTHEEKIAARVKQTRRATLKYREKLANQTSAEEIEFRRKRAARESIDPRIARAARSEDFTDRNIHGIEALEEHHCRFICNSDTSAPIYCGAPKRNGSYCGLHHHLTHGPETYAEQRVAQ